MFYYISDGETTEKIFTELSEVFLFLQECADKEMGCTIFSTPFDLHPERQGASGE
jgi:hypothetical protein